MRRIVRPFIALALLVPAPLAAWTPLEVSIFTPLTFPTLGWEGDVHGLRVNVLFARSREVIGLDLGFWNDADVLMAGVGAGLFLNCRGDMAGMQACLFAVSKRMLGLQAGLWLDAYEQMRGVQLGLIVEATKMTSSSTYWSGGKKYWSASYEGARMSGLQAGGVVIAGWMHGMQLAAMTRAMAEMRGLQVGVAYLASGGDAHGVQIGGVTVIEGTARGVVVGGVNYAGKLRGVQIGLVNICDTLEGLQIGGLNIAAHGGIFPIMPVFNVGIKF